MRVRACVCVCARAMIAKETVVMFPHIFFKI